MSTPQMGMVADAQGSQSLVFLTEEGYKPYVPPKDDEQLKLWLELFLGLRFSDRACCPGHVAPLTAIADAYFARHPVVVWHASRGLGGKSTALAGLSLLELMLGANISILGGSTAQSKRVHEVERETWKHVVKVGNSTVPNPIRAFLASEPTSYETRTVMGNKLRALTASTRSARGPHPQRLRIDEVDEMALPVFHSAMGQTLASNGIPAQTVISSTHQYPDGTMTEILKIAAQRGWPIYRWCFKETLQSNGGWLLDGEVERKKHEVGDRMWQIEFELQEPSIEGRLIDTEAVQQLFDGQLGEVRDEDGKYYEFQAPVPTGKYVTSADWAKEQDHTVIITLRHDVSPVRLVAFQRMQKLPWPLMTARFDERVRRYGGQAIHDANTHGNVVADWLEVDAIPHVAMGRDRHGMYTDYVNAVERLRIRCPKIASMQDEHKYVTEGDVYTAHGHPPDTVAAMALAWRVVQGRTDGEAKPPTVILKPIAFGETPSGPRATREVDWTGRPGV